MEFFNKIVMKKHRWVLREWGWWGEGKYLPLKQLNLMQQNVTVFCAAYLCNVIKSTRKIPRKKKCHRNLTQNVGKRRKKVLNDGSYVYWTVHHLDS